MDFVECLRGFTNSKFCRVGENYAPLSSVSGICTIRFVSLVFLSVASPDLPQCHGVCPPGGGAALGSGCDGMGPIPEREIASLQIGRRSRRWWKDEGCLMTAARVTWENAVVQRLGAWLAGWVVGPTRQRAEIVGGVGKRSVVVEQARTRGGRRRAREEDVTACRSAVPAPRPPWASAAASCAAGCSAWPSRRRSTSERKRQREK
jgi:hypothetical protein